MNSANDILLPILAFLSGSLPTAYLAGKWAKGIDIRQHGSGNVGATNVFRTMGKGWGTFVLIVDILKGVLASALLAQVPGVLESVPDLLRQLIFGFCAVAGHTWTPWLQFHGGKGVATSAGALLGIFPAAAGGAILLWGISFLTTRYVSVSSILAAACFPILIWVFYPNIEGLRTILGLSFLFAAFIIYNHRSNISRLMKGQENRAQLWKKKR